MQNIRILAIDPATQCGWATSEKVFGCWDLSVRRDESNGMKLLKLESNLEKILQVHGIDVIAYERPAGQYKNAIIHQSELIGIIVRFCEVKGIQYRSYSATEIKKFATSKGNANKGKMILAAKERLGYQGNNDNEADALWILKLLEKDLNIIY